MTDFTPPLIIKLNPDDSVDVEDVMTKIFKLITEENPDAGDNFFSVYANVLTLTFAKLIFTYTSKETDEFFIEMQSNLLRENLRVNRAKNEGT